MEFIFLSIQDFFKQTDPVLYISLITLLISSLTLWFSHLKGPDIDICNKIEVEVEDWTNYQQDSTPPDRIPYYIRLKTTGGVFLNNGSKSGVIIKIESEFKPTDDFNPFLKEYYYTVGNLPLLLSSGDTGVVGIKPVIHTVIWTSDINMFYVRTYDNIKKAVYDSLEDNKELFKKFVDFIQSKETLGEISFHIECSKKRWFGVKLGKKDIGTTNIMNDCKIYIDLIIDRLNNWDTELYTSLKLEILPTILDQLYDVFSDNVGILAGDEYENTNVKLVDELFKKYDRSTNPIFLLFEREREIIEEIELLDEYMRSYNSKIRFIKSLRQDPSSELIREINVMREELITMNKSMRESIEKLKSKIVRELQSHTRALEVEKE